MTKAVTVMLDDIINNFSQTVNAAGVEFDARTQSIFDEKLAGVFTKPPGELTDLAVKVFTETAAKPDGIALLDWLKENGWIVVLCANRDIRLCYDITVNWLKKYNVAYDYIFTATSPAGLCMDMDIGLMIYNLPEGNKNNINVVSFPFSPADGQKQPLIIGEFKSFEEVKECILKSSC